MQLWTQDDPGGTWRKTDIEPFPIPGNVPLMQLLLQYGIAATEPTNEEWGDEPRRLIVFNHEEVRTLARLGEPIWGAERDPAYFFLIGVVLVCVESMPVNPDMGRETLPSVLYIDGNFPLLARPHSDAVPTLAIDITGLTGLDLRIANEEYRHYLDNPQAKTN